MFTQLLREESKGLVLPAIEIDATMTEDDLTGGDGNLRALNRDRSRGRLLARRMGTHEAQQPGVLIEDLPREVGPQFTQVRKVIPQVCDHADHAGHKSLHIGGVLQLAISPIHDLGPGQRARDLLRAAEADLKKIAPAADYAPPTDPRPVTDEDGLPLAGDELLPPEKLHLLRVIVVHKPRV